MRRRGKLLYGLFERSIDGKWQRMGTGAFTKQTAIRLYQNALLAHVLSATPERRLMPIGHLIQGAKS